MYSYYILFNQDINNDGNFDNLILKYNKKKFVGLVPIDKELIQVNDKIFAKNNMPQIKGKYKIMIIKKDLNKDGVKDYIMLIMNSKNKILAGVPITKSGFIDVYSKHFRQIGGNVQQYIPPPQPVEIKDTTGFIQSVKKGAGDMTGRIGVLVAFEALSNLFDS